MNFLALVKADCAAHNVALQLIKCAYVETRIGVRCNGFFEEYPLTLAVATGKTEERWMKTLVHEYAHMTQWKDQTPIWKRATVPVDAEDIVELWYDKKIDLTKTQRARWIGLARDVEKEAEQRAIRLIKEHRLNIDSVAYAQHANAYLYFWTFTGLTRRWYKIGKEPYNISEIVAAMPKTLNVNHAILSPRLESLYRKYC